jgi:hypothetical protein
MAGAQGGGCVSDLRDLAARYVALSGEIEDVRNQMRLLLANGEGSRPTPARLSEPGGKLDPKAKPHPNAAKAAVVEGQIVALLKERPMSRGEIAKATQGKASSTQMRLNRLLEKGLVQHGERGLWSATSTPPT